MSNPSSHLLIDALHYAYSPRAGAQALPEPIRRGLNYPESGSVGAGRDALFKTVRNEYELVADADQHIVPLSAGLDSRLLLTALTELDIVDNQDNLASNRENALDWNPPFNEWESVSAVPAPNPEFGTWTKDGDNPVIQAADLNFTPSAKVNHPSLIRVGDTYHVFFAGSSSDLSDAAIGHATSTDLKNWSMDDDNPVLQTSSSGFDSGRIFQPEILRVGDTYYLYYSGDDSDTNADNAKIGVATADATLDEPFANFSKSANNPILSDGGSNDWDSQQVQEPEVIFDGGRYIMAYRGDGDGEQMGMAWAENPTDTFTKSLYNPVKSEGNVASNSTVADHELLIIGNRFHLFYLSDDSNSDDVIFYAYSDNANLTEWTDHRDNPVLTQSGSGFDEQSVRAPAVLREPARYIMLFDGKDANGDRKAIGLATLTNYEVA